MYRVLIVDDDRAVRYMLKRFKGWNRFGFIPADEACDGKEALKKLQAGEFDNCHFRYKMRVWRN